MAELVTWLALLVFIVASAAGEYCTERNSVIFIRTFHCPFGCCGLSYDEYCCVNNGGIIAGIVVAVLVGIAFLSACICCLVKHHGHSGRVIRPLAPANNVFVVSTETTTTAAAAYPSTIYSTNYTNNYGVLPRTVAHGAGPTAPLPPGYAQPATAPPAYSYNDPAYPPGYSPNIPTFAK